MGGVVAQPSNGISMAVKHNAEIHGDITGIILRLVTRTPGFPTKAGEKSRPIGVSKSDRGRYPA